MCQHISDNPTPAPVSTFYTFKVTFDDSFLFTVCSISPPFPLSVPFVMIFDASCRSLHYIHIHLIAFHVLFVLPLFCLLLVDHFHCMLSHALALLSISCLIICDMFSAEGISTRQKPPHTHTPCLSPPRTSIDSVCNMQR